MIVQADINIIQYPWHKDTSSYIYIYISNFVILDIVDQSCIVEYNIYIYIVLC